MIDAITASEEDKLESLENCYSKGLPRGYQDKKGWTLLHWAAYYENMNVSQYLIERGENADYKNDVGSFPYDLVKDSNTHLYNFLKRKAEEPLLMEDAISAVQNKKMGALVDCYKRGLPKDQRDKAGWTLLHWSAFWDMFEMSIFLIDMGESAGTDDGKGIYPHDNLERNTSPKHYDFLKAKNKEQMTIINATTVEQNDQKISKPILTQHRLSSERKINSEEKKSNKMISECKVNAKKTRFHKK